MLTVDEYGLFIGEISGPYQNGIAFYEKNIEVLFSGMHDSLDKTDSEDKKGNKKEPFCYFPKAYCMLGNYDIAVLSLLDDFHFGAKYFHPYSFLNKTDQTEGKGFNYHISMGTHSYDSKLAESETLVKKAQRTFLKKDDRYPFIGITNIKIKNSLIIGTGIKLINICINALRVRLMEYGAKVGGFDFVIIEPISWNEITIIFFSNCLRKISNSLFLVREMNVNYIIQEATKAKLLENDDILLETLLHKESKGSKKEILQSHAYTHTFSNIGIDVEWLKNVDPSQQKYKVERFMDCSPPEGFESFTRWFIKPAYLETFLKENELQGNFNQIIGNGDIEMRENGQASFPNLITELRGFLFNDKKNTSIERMVRKTKSIPKFSYDPNTVNSIILENIEYNGSTLPDLSISGKLQSYAFTRGQITKLRSALILLRVSRPLRERINRAFINFNDCIQDAILYSTFIELRDYLRKLYDFILADSENRVLISQDVRHNRYNAMVNSFDHAYKSIIVHSYRLYSVTDFNLEYNGGIQTIMSGFDSLFKYFRKRIYKQTLSPYKAPYISMVSAEQSIKTNMDSLFINYNHLFSPEFFLAALPKEAINHYLFNPSRISESDKLNIRSIIDLYKANEFALAEQKIIEYTNGRVDEYALLYLAYGLIDQAQEQITSIFKSRILIEITKDDNETNRSIFLEYLDAIYQELILYFLEDTFASWVLPLHDYLFWLMATFAQESTSYNKDGTFNEKALIRLMLRLSFMQDDTYNISYEKYVTVSPVNMEQIKYHKPKIDEFIKRIALLEIIPGVTINILRNCMMSTINNNMYDNLMDKSEIIDDLTFEKKQEFVKVLKSGNIGNLGLTANYSSVRGLILAYLDVIKNLYPKNGKNMVLLRNKEGHPDFSDHHYRIPDIGNVIVLDPTGGNFTIGEVVRPKYFRIRATLIRILLDFSLREKLELFDIE